MENIGWRSRRCSARQARLSRIGEKRNLDAHAPVRDKAGVDELGPITDPNSVLLGLAAVAGLIASFFWLRVGRGQSDKAPSWADLRFAALATSAALFLGSLGYLI